MPLFRVSRERYFEVVVRAENKGDAAATRPGYTPYNVEIIDVEDDTEEVDVEEVEEDGVGVDFKKSLLSKALADRVCPSCGKPYPYGDPRSVVSPPQPCFECVRKDR